MVVKKKWLTLRTSYLLRMFAISFMVFSVLPLIVFAYLYTRFDATGHIAISQNEFAGLVMIIGISSFILFWNIRKRLAHITLLSENIKQALFEKMDRSIVLDLAKEEGEVADLARAFGDILGRLEANMQELEETKQTLTEVVSKVGRALASVENFDLLIQLILETVVNAIGVKKGVIFTLEEDDNLLLKAAVGVEEFTREEVVRSLEPSVQWVIKEEKTLFTPFLEEKEKKQPLPRNKVFSPPFIHLPLIYHDQVWGALCLSEKQRESNFSEEELKIISHLSYQIAISFENVRLNRGIERTYFETMSALALAVEAKDPYSQGHSRRVGKYAVKIGKEMGLEAADLKTLRDAAQLHDIGKIGIGDSILKKPGRLTMEEIEIMKEHPAIGENIVKPLKTFRHLLEVMRHHHEFLDGSGYPDGLKADQIPVPTRILTVADIFDALTSDRPYRKALSVEESKKELQDMVNAGKLDGGVVSVLGKLVDAKKLHDELDRKGKFPYRGKE